MIDNNKPLYIIIHNLYQIQEIFIIFILTLDIHLPLH